MQDSTDQNMRGRLTCSLALVAQLWPGRDTLFDMFLPLGLVNPLERKQDSPMKLTSDYRSVSLAFLQET